MGLGELSPAVVLLSALLGMLAGGAGAILGIGGGIFVVPFLSAVLELPVHLAVGVSLCAVVATGTTAGLTYVKRGEANVPLGLLFVSVTLVGTTGGARFALGLPPRALFLLFGGVALLLASFVLWRQIRGAEPRASPAGGAGLFAATYRDEANGREVSYDPVRVAAVLPLVLAAGVLGGMLGIGGGVVNVTVMNLLCRMPLKAAVATSTFLFGTASLAGVAHYAWAGKVDPSVAAAVTVGVIVGSNVGSKLQVRMSERQLALAFAALLVLVAARMLYVGLAS